MSHPRALLLALLASLGLLVGWGPMASPAAACSCAAVSRSTALASADVAFVGDLTGTSQAPLALGAPDGATTYTFDVLSIAKGDAVPDQQVVSARSSAACGLELSGPGPYLVLADRTPSAESGPLKPGQLSAGLCGGTRALTAEEAADFVGATPLGAAGEEDGVGTGPVVFLAVVTVGAVLGFLAIVRRHRRRVAAAEAARPLGRTRRRPSPPPD